MKKRHIYVSCELGSYSIKIIVSEVIGNETLVLSSSNTRCKGIQNGEIVDVDVVKEYLNSGLNKVEEMLGIKVEEVILGINVKDKKYDVIDEKINIALENHIIDSKDVNELLNNACNNNKKDDETVLLVMPINFKVDNKEIVKNPKGMIASSLELKAVIVKVNSDLLTPYIELFKSVGVKLVDITLAEIGDYFTCHTKDFDKGVSTLINIGFNKMNISIFNKGIMVKNKVVNEGSILIDKELSMRYNIKRSQARKLKENFALAKIKYSEFDDTIELNTKSDSKVIINQQDVTEIVEARISYLLKLAKKEINLLTKREISNIIITGGITDLVGFLSVSESIFNCRVTVLDLETIGIRNNMYSSCYGLVKYFHYKLNLRELDYSMVDMSDYTIETNDKAKSKDSILNKMFGYFKDE